MIDYEKKNKEHQKKMVILITENQKLYQRVFGGADGDEILKDLERRCFIKSTTYDDNPGRMSFNEGRRSIFVYIQNLLEKDLKELLEEVTK